MPWSSRISPCFVHLTNGHHTLLFGTPLSDVHSESLPLLWQQCTTPIVRQISFDATKLKARIEICGTLCTSSYFEDVERYKRLQEFLASSLSGQYYLSLPMISALQSPTSTKDTDYPDLVFKPLKMDLSTRYLVDSLDPSKPTVRSSLTNVSNIGLCPPLAPSVIGISVNDSPSLSRFRSTMHLNRVATVDRHDADAWTQEWKVHDSELDVVAFSTPLGSNGTVPDGPFPVNVARSSLAPMEPRTERPREQIVNAGGLCKGTAVYPHDWTSLVAPCSNILHVWPDVTTSSYSREDLSGGRRRVGEILLRCGVFDVSGMSSIEFPAVECGHDVGPRPVDAPVVSSVTAELRSGEDELLITALADWTSEWVHALVIQPYLRGDFRLQYQGKPNRAPASVASRIRRVLDNVENPVQVAIHTLWFIGTLTGNGAHDSAPFLSIPIFRYLHNNGTFIAEDFMFRTFVACAMISDKTVNDDTLATNTWNRLTRIPQVILNATEKYTLSCLKWNVVMTWTQWQDTVNYLRSCIKMSSAFDPFSYDGTSPSGIMARHLDEMINLSHMDETCTSQWGSSAVEILSPQPIRHFTHWEVFSTAEWCPEDDPIINQKQQTIGIAPGSVKNSSTLKVGTTAKDLLDSILGSRNITDLAYLAQPAGTSFCGSFGVIGARLAHTMRIASACQSTSWVPSHS